MNLAAPIPLRSDAVLRDLLHLHPKLIDLSLDRVYRLLDALGRPQDRLAPVVHIAGTNGKGSSLAMLDAMACAARLCTQRYISPHLIRFHERILFNGEPVAEATLLEALSDVERLNAEQPITFFEITTALALSLFAARRADLCLLETGLGGRLDATNVVCQPKLTAITSISMDHQAFLGDSLDKIAFEKAGILKPNVPCVVGPQAPEALEVIEARAHALDAPLLRYGSEWTVRLTGDALALTYQGMTAHYPCPALAGAHQIDNAGLALVMAHVLGLSGTAMRAGLRDVRWPGRLQRLAHGSLRALLPPTDELWLDGGHNPGAGAALAASLRVMPTRPMHLVLGMLANKDITGFLAPLVPLLASVRLVPIEGESAALDPQDALSALAPLKVVATAHASVAEALAAIAAQDARIKRVLIAGSLYLAGWVLRTNDEAQA